MLIFAILFLSLLIMLLMFFSEMYNQLLHTVLLWKLVSATPKYFYLCKLQMRNFHGHETNPLSIFQRFQSHLLTVNVLAHTNFSAFSLLTGVFLGCS